MFVWQSNLLGGTLHKKETVPRHLTNKDRANSFQTNVVLHRPEQQQQQNSLLYVQIYIYTYIVEKVQILSLDAKQLGNLRISLKLHSVTTESIKKNRMWTIVWFSVKMKMLKSTAVASWQNGKRRIEHLILRQQTQCSSVVLGLRVEIKSEFNPPISNPYNSPTDSASVP